MSVARARPLLGTVVGIRIDGLDERAAAQAADAAFGEIAAIHRCMSFHEAGSDLARMHSARGAAIVVDARTYAVLERALSIAHASNGVFDPCVAGKLVEWGLLPTPGNPPPPGVAANWRDIELLPRRRVRLAKPVWIDLGGIAKGFAVDRALAILRDSGADEASVNAGGDLARFGQGVVAVMLDDGTHGLGVAVEIGTQALATSTSAPVAIRADVRPAHSERHAAHVHGRLRRAVGRKRTVSVIADSCCSADALTKVMLADARTGARVLRRLHARAYLYEPARGWRAYGC